MSVVVVMPAYNAASHVRKVIERLRALDTLALQRIVVVNDGSRDDTHAVVSALPASGTPITLIDRPHNGGYGAAMKTGIAAALASDPDVLATVHADGQYSPEALPDLISSMQARGLDVLQGSRIAGGGALSGGMPLYKYAANACLNKLENAALDLQLTDYHSGYLLYARRALRALPFDSLSNSFDFDLECIAAARARGLQVGEAPIPTHYGDEVSHLQPIAYGLRVLRVLWNYRRGRYDTPRACP